MATKQQLNDFFVSCFNSILRIEEIVLEKITDGKLTIKEIHFIEAVFKTKEKGVNTFSNIAESLGITIGTLMTSFSRLKNKGYLTKKQSLNDKRTYYVLPTTLAEYINVEHANFHDHMIDSLLDEISQEKVDEIAKLLKKLSVFFNDYKKRVSCKI